MNKPIYIMSLDASDIYYHNHREMDLKRDYLGMIPFSLESIKLTSDGLKTKYIEQRDKYISDDIINVKFKSKVRNADEMLVITKKKLNYAKNEHHQENLIEYCQLLEEHSSMADNAAENYWDEISIEELRKELYTNGFKIRFVNSRTGNVKEIEYVVYKRSSAKSRTGQCLFIKKSLYNRMIKWSRMSLPFKKGQKIDLASLLAYESLVGSSLEDTIQIDPDKILIVDDVDSKFNQIANVVRKNEDTGYLDSFKEETEISNSLFDGESLLETKYFKNGNGMILLRNHMFKSASFNCEIQKFLRDNCPNDIHFDDWKIKNMFDEEIYAKDIDMIITPSSLKALKFSNVLPSKTEKEMWNYWKEKVKEDGNLFGICKHEKESKLGHYPDGNILQQTSYQMINCLPVNEYDVEELLHLEKEYISKLKEDNDFLLDEIYKNRDITNGNEALYSIYKLNKGIVFTSVFKKFKKKFIHKKVKHAMKGKIKVRGDYCVLLGNPLEFLLHSIGKLNLDTYIPELKDNEVYCTLYGEDAELVGFRNPNTSPSNVLVVKNTYSSLINKYFNLTHNIIAVNAINFPIQDILSGCDYDSDTMLVISEEKFIEIAKRCFGYYDVCINHIEGQKKNYRLTNHDHYEIDNQLSHSQRNIGKVVNLGQFCMSAYWDLINNGESGEHVDELLKKVDVMTILSGIAIDMAKKFYDIEIDNEIKQVEKNEQLRKRKKKPNFWVSVSQSRTIKNRVEHYDCPMDFLISKLSQLENADSYEEISFTDFVNDFPTRNVNTPQMERVENLIMDYDSKFKEIQALSNDNKREMIVELEQEIINKLSKWKLKADTISMLLIKTASFRSEFLLKTLKLLYETHESELIKVIKTK